MKLRFEEGVFLLELSAIEPPLKTEQYVQGCEILHSTGAIYYLTHTRNILQVDHIV